MSDDLSDRSRWEHAHAAKLTEIARVRDHLITLEKASETGAIAVNGLLFAAGLALAGPTGLLSLALSVANGGMLLAAVLKERDRIRALDRQSRLLRELALDLKTIEIRARQTD